MVDEKKTRVRRLRLSPEIVVELSKEGPKRTFGVTAGLPADTELVSAFFDFDRACVVCVVRSAEFEPVPEGEVIPELPPVMFSLVSRQDNLAV